jgi:hypothetical protein
VGGLALRRGCRGAGVLKPGRVPGMDPRGGREPDLSERGPGWLWSAEPGAVEPRHRRVRAHGGAPAASRPGRMAAADDGLTIRDVASPGPVRCRCGDDPGDEVGPLLGDRRESGWIGRARTTARKRARRRRRATWSRPTGAPLWVPGVVQVGRAEHPEIEPRDPVRDPLAGRDHVHAVQRRSHGSIARAVP